MDAIGGRLAVFGSRLTVVVWLAAILSSGCGGSGRGTPDAASDVSPDPGVDLPALNKECESCHDLEAFAKSKSDEGSGPRKWMVQQGNGLVRVEPALPSPVRQFGLAWVARGRHQEPSQSGCSACHPVADDGTGHGLRVYPDVGTVFEGGTDCAASCHAWLGDTVTVEGFEDAQGQRPEYKGSIRPFDLLSGADNGHSKLWKDGARPDAAGFRMSAYNPGCGGCHNLAAESHGTIMGCLDCHKFAGDVHDMHVQAANTMMDDVDPGAGNDGLPSCAYCHVAQDPSMDRSGAVCYNCHLSGHQPLDASGKAHFWQ